MQRPRPQDKTNQQQLSVSNKRLRSLHHSPPSLLLKYPFLMPLLLACLNDRDVLSNLLLTGKVMKPMLLNYAAKSTLSPDQATIISGWDRYLPVKIINLHHVQDEEWRPFPHLESIEFYDEDEMPIASGTLPLTLKRIVFGSWFEDRLKRNILPPGLKYLDFGKDFDYPIDPGAIPDSVEEIISESFDQPLDHGVLPKSLTKLHLADFADTLEPGVLPDSLIKLHLDSFDSPLQLGSLPNSLQHLDLRRFSYSMLEDQMPSSLKTLALGEFFEGPLFLPSTLMCFELFAPLSFITITSPFPSSLTELYLGVDVEQSLPSHLLPTSIIKLTIQQRVVIDSIPNSVIDLTYDCQRQIPVGAIPNSVKSLTFGTRYHERLLPGIIPASVNHLDMSLAYDQLLVHGSLPNSITHLSLGATFNQVLMPGVLPESLKHLSFSTIAGRFNQPLCSMSYICEHSQQPKLLYSLPRSITHLKLSRDFNQPLDHDSIPANVEYLILGDRFSHTSSVNMLPASLRVLVASSQCVVDLTRFSKVRQMTIPSEVDWQSVSMNNL